MKKGKQRYSSLAELREDWGLPPVVKKTKDHKKLKNQQDKFSKHHLCKACKKPLTILEGTNTMVCTNPSCKGIKFTDKEDSIRYYPSFDLLDEKGAEIANNIFS